MRSCVCMLPRVAGDKLKRSTCNTGRCGRRCGADLRRFLVTSQGAVAYASCWLQGAQCMGCGCRFVPRCSTLAHGTHALAPVAGAAPRAQTSRRDLASDRADPAHIRQAVGRLRCVLRAVPGYSRSRGLVGDIHADCLDLRAEPIATRREPTGSLKSTL